MSPPLIGITCPSKSTIAPSKGAPLSGARDSYGVAVMAAGGIPVYIPLLPEWTIEGGAKALAKRYLERLDGIIFTGGENVILTDEDDPESLKVDFCETRNAFELALLYEAVSNGLKIPIFGICRGMQLLMHKGGAQLIAISTWQRDKNVPHFLGTDPEPEWELIAHHMSVAQDSAVAKCIEQSTLSINSIHRMGAASLGTNTLHLSAVSQSEDGLLEVVESSDPNDQLILGIQGHPEALVRKYLELGKPTGDPGEALLKIFRMFVVQASKKANR